ncbi:MAG: Ig-like domain-containing protein [Clostridia bacterium]|nr:Ig-like domain-containing protein [Clostridia bacterium]
MRKFTKCISILLLFSLLLGNALVISAASSVSIYAGSVDGQRGETVIVPITINSNSGFVSLSLNINYDESALTLTEVRDQGLLGNEYHKSIFSSPYRLTWINDTLNENITVTGTVVYLYFTINHNADKGDYSIVLTMNQDDALDASGNNVDVRLTNGTISVVEEHQCGWGEWEEYTKNYHLRTCNECGETEYEKHNFDDGEITLEPTYDESGEITYTCEDCGYEKVEEIPPDHEHDYIPYKVVEPTCTAEGYTIFLCSCSDSYQDDFTPKSNHSFVGQKCTYCGATRTDTVPVIGITLSETNVTMKIGDGKWIDATVLPGDATNQLVNWTSSDESIVDVATSGDNNERGFLVAKANGTVTITATTADGNFKAECRVTVGGKTIVGYRWYAGILRHKVIYSDGTYDMEDCAPKNCVCGRDYDDPAPTLKTQVVISSHEALPGETVKVTVSLENNPGIASAILNVSFDQSLLTLLSVEYNTAMGGQTVPPQSMNSSVTLYWVSPFADMSEDCVFATLTFKVSENAKAGDSTKLNITYEPDNVYNLAEENVALNITPGEVTVIDYIPGDINGDGVVNNKDVTRLMQYFAGWSVTVNTPALDVNNDGSYNNKDVTRLMQYLAGWNVEIH